MKKIASRFLPIVLCFYMLIQTVSAAKLLIPGGQVIGIELQDQTVTIADFDETIPCAKDSGLQVGDRITRIDDTRITCAEDVRQALQRANGAVEILVMRQQQEKKVHITPEITSEGPRLGLMLRQGVTGIGTVTWYDPDTGLYGALGHGVSTQGKQLVRLHRGSTYGAAVMSVKKGRSGQPGQLMGAVRDNSAVGTVTKNTPQGIFGTLSSPVSGTPMPVCEPGQVRTGPAIIRSTVLGDTPREYSVEILKIYPQSKGCTRNLLIQVTDPALLETTGGIVQGMSGSPIIQNGKLVGAVTHVLVNDPTTGYGIFIENMLDAAA